MGTDNSKKNIGLMAFLTLFSFVSVLVDFDIPEGYDFNTINVWSNISHSVHDGPISNILILLGIVSLLYISFCKLGKAKNSLLLLFLSLGLSVLNYIGISFDRIGSWDLYFNIHNGQLIKAFIKTTGMTIISFHVVKCLYYCFDKKSLFFSSFASTNNNRKSPINYLSELLGKHPFAFSFVSLIILYIPYIIVSYPTTFQEDADSVLLVYYKESFRYLFDLVPLLYTFVARIFFEIGIRLFGSENVGLFLLSITQFLIVVLAISLMINYLVKKERLRPSIAFLIIAFFGFLP